MTGKKTAETIRNLLARCQVTTLQACKRAGINPSTFYRWEHGSTPSDSAVKRLKRATMEIAAEGGTLPADLNIELDQLRQNTELPHPQQRDLASRVDRLERVVEEQLGVTL